MLMCCLYVIHWSVSPNYTIPLALVLAIVLTIRVAWSMAREKFGRERHAIPRVQSVCDDLRRRASKGMEQAAAEPNDELSEYGVPPAWQ